MYLAKLFVFLYSTFKQDCPAHISVKIDRAGSALEVRSINTEHNHIPSQVIQHKMFMCFTHVY